MFARLIDNACQRSGQTDSLLIDLGIPVIQVPEDGGDDLGEIWFNTDTERIDDRDQYSRCSTPSRT